MCFKRMLELKSNDESASPAANNYFINDVQSQCWPV